MTRRSAVASDSDDDENDADKASIKSDEATANSADPCYIDPEVVEFWTPTDLKRMAAEEEANSCKSKQSSSRPATLPSDLIATILEMAATPIHTIMSMGIGSRLVVREVLPKLRRLVIWRSNDLDIPMANQYLSPSKVTSIDICCLISLADSASISSQKYNVKASHSIPFFLSQFPMLQRVYLGGTRRLPVLSMYEPFRCVHPEDHREFHNGLLWALCGAFQTRALNQNLSIEGLVYSGIYCLWSQDRARGVGNDDEHSGRASCTFCDAILDHFPVPMIIRHTVRSRGDSSLCFGERQIYERLMKRSEKLVWKALLDDTIEVLRHDRPTVVSITPSSATRIVNLCLWDLRPNCSETYWEKILDGFSCISRTLFMVISYVDNSVEENRFDIFEDNPRAQLRELLTTNEEDRTNQ